MDSKVVSTNWGKSGFVKDCDTTMPPTVYTSYVRDDNGSRSINGLTATWWFHRTRSVDLLTAADGAGCGLWNADVAADNTGGVVGTNSCESNYHWPDEEFDDYIFWSYWDDQTCAQEAWWFINLPTSEHGTNASVCISNMYSSGYDYADSSESVHVTNIYVYSGVFSDLMLRGYMASKLPPYPVEWTAGSANSSFFFCDDSHYEALGQEAKYRFKIPDSQTNETYRVHWKIVAIYPDGSKADVAELSEDIEGTGDPSDYAYGINHELEMPEEEGVRMVSDVVVEILPRPAPPAGSGGGGGGFWSGGSGGCGSCSSGGHGSDGGGKGEDVASFNVSMGGWSDGRPAGSLSFTASQPSQQMFNPSQLRFSGNHSTVDVVTNETGGVRQVFAPQALAVVVSNDANSYEIQFFHTNGVGAKVSG